ncbi:PAS domain S-box protein [Sphaerisporangium sp. TRM90804]|uniref:PAS domain-containing sensor histidine kinase n=1 Tax=Sphaerisporangium sp. TRM90804 TaxID=3031113 RepID=UPI0024481DAF|nr:PAS domain S-box protein [Sphaerisporangium sp. TRM90804]MDH2424426.1 PAS domain S-box protein [Sphaerisporangium sp. TRM90804]
MPEARHPEHELYDSEERFRLLVQSVVDYAIFMLDPGGRIVSWNAGAERIKGYAAHEIIGRHFSVFYPPDDIAADKPGTELELAVADGRLEDEGWRLRRDGTRFWANVVITALYDADGSLRGFGKVTRDMTERRSAERALDERGRLLSHLIRAQEAERQRIAWDVHDDTIQAMVAFGMRVQLIADRLPAEHAEAMSRLGDTVSATIDRLRDLTFRLHPPELDHSGLPEALSTYLAHVVAEAGLTWELRHDLRREPSPEIAITVYRICQEALTNVLKHARASSVTVSLSADDQGLLVGVADDGVGPSPDAPGRREHFGLIEMRERAELAGGWWSMEAAPGGGTIVRFWLPTPPSEASAERYLPR